jgi:hypothetical protein
MDEAGVMAGPVAVLLDDLRDALDEAIGDTRAA